ncbi:MAG: hypothetical protein PUC18_12990 [Prevotellaceae bacterium]|nr:hypothetical protein [Prevotellaceae bacterium]
MDYEQKYKESLERAKEQLEGAKVFDYDNEQIAHDIRTTVYSIFPELKKLEDEKIRKELIDAIQGLWENDALPMPLSVKRKDNWLAWLEKQKPDEWSEEDEIALGDALWCCKQAASIAKNENDMGNVWYAETWLKNLKERVQSQLQWKPSEKHKFNIGDIISNGQAVYRVDDITKNCIGQDCYSLVNVESEENGTRYISLTDSEGKHSNVGEIAFFM